jgi:hypothetical protein
MALGYNGNILCPHWVKIVLNWSMSDLLSEAEALPDEPSRSKLEPYADVIAVLRRKRKSYVQIAAFLTKTAKIEGGVDPSTVWDFVQAEAKRGRRQRVSPGLSAQVVSAPEPTSATPPSTPPRPKQPRAVYVPPTQPAAAFLPDALKTNDELEEG